MSDTTQGSAPEAHPTPESEDPTDPAGPTAPADPADPAAPTGPTAPTAPADPTDPADTTGPIDDGQVDDPQAHDGPSEAEQLSQEAALATVADREPELADHVRRAQGQHGETPGDTTEPLGGVLSGERDYVAVDPMGVSGDQDVPKGDEEVGRDTVFDPATDGQQAEGQG